MEISTPRGRAGGAVPPSPNLGPPPISETIRARRLKFYTHLDRTKCSFRAWQFPLGCAGGGGQTADREASSCNAVQLPRFLVCICFEDIIYRLIFLQSPFLDLVFQRLWRSLYMQWRHFSQSLGGLTFPTLLPLCIPLTVMCDMRKNICIELSVLLVYHWKNIANSYRYHNG